MTEPTSPPAGEPPAPSGNPGTAPATAPWYGTDVDADTKGFVELKGWDSPGKAIKGYRDLEAFVGADKAGRGVVWPKDDTDTEGWKALNTKLGVPESPDAYGIKPPAGGNEDFAKAVAPAMHALGLTAKQAQGLSAFVNEWEAKQSADYETSSKAATEAALAAYKSKLGAAFEPTVELGKRAAATFGVNEQQFAALEETLGLEGTVGLFAAIGKKLGEDQFVGDGRPSGGDLSPEAAKARFAQLLKDEGWMARMKSGDLVALDEKDRLNANMLGVSLAEYRAAKAA